MFIFIFVFASEVSNLLQSAQSAYETGDITTAIQKLDSAKSIMEREKNNASSEDYIELNSWDIVKLKPSEYVGKKVKIRTMYGGVMNDGSIYLSNVATFNSFDESLIDKIITLQKYSKYIFSGTVVDNGRGSTSLYVEAIE